MGEIQLKSILATVSDSHAHSHRDFCVTLASATVSNASTLLQLESPSLNHIRAFDWTRLASRLESSPKSGERRTQTAQMDGKNGPRDEPVNARGKLWPVCVCERDCCLG